VFSESTREGAMRPGHYTVTPAAVRAHAQLLCQKHLRLRDHGPKCTAGMLWTILCYAACRITSLAAACTALRRAPSDTAVHEALQEVVRRLLDQAARAGVRPRYVLLDRGFCSVEVIRYLQAARRPFLMPLPLRGHQADHPKGPSGSRVFGYYKRSGWAQYTLT